MPEGVCVCLFVCLFYLDIILFVLFYFSVNIRIQQGMAGSSLDLACSCLQNEETNRF